MGVDFGISTEKREVCFFSVIQPTCTDVGGPGLAHVRKGVFEWNQCFICKGMSWLVMGFGLFIVLVTDTLLDRPMNDPLWYVFQIHAYHDLFDVVRNTCYA